MRPLGVEPQKVIGSMMRRWGQLLGTLLLGHAKLTSAVGKESLSQLERATWVSGGIHRELAFEVCIGICEVEPRL